MGGKFEHGMLIREDGDVVDVFVWKRIPQFPALIVNLNDPMKIIWELKLAALGDPDNEDDYISAIRGIKESLGEKDEPA